ncbi:MAG: efflux RND transporter periplasmic adaptor subunit [Bacteroidota bacterium]|nr:efflux RND transporter periplasmic adaptor subunit [Bacteroidota bacterium]
MKKLFVLILVVTFSCSERKSYDLKNIDYNDLSDLREINKNINEELISLNSELEKINSAISELDENERLQLITIYKIKQESFKHFIEVQGDIKSRKNLLLLPELNGILKKIYVEEGTQVNKGQILAEIDDSGLKNQLSQLELQAELSKIKFNRIKNLWEQKIGSEIEYLEAKTIYKTQQKSVAQLKEQLKKAKIFAPFTGSIDEIIANTGSNLIAGLTPIFRIVNLDNVYTEADVPEKYLQTVKTGTPLIVEIPMLGKSYETIIKQAGNFIKPNNRSFRIEAPISNQDRSVKLNLTTKLKINDYSNPKSILIPLRILKEDSKGNFYVFKLIKTEKENVFISKKVFIDIGKDNGNKIEIINGLSDGDIIINEGGERIQDGQKVKLAKINS